MNWENAQGQTIDPPRQRSGPSSVLLSYSWEFDSKVAFPVTICSVGIQSPTLTDKPTSASERRHWKRWRPPPSVKARLPCQCTAVLVWVGRAACVDFSLQIPKGGKDGCAYTYSWWTPWPVPTPPTPLPFYLPSYPHTSFQMGKWVTGDNRLPLLAQTQTPRRTRIRTLSHIASDSLPFCYLKWRKQRTQGGKITTLFQFHLRVINFSHLVSHRYRWGFTHHTTHIFTCDPLKIFLTHNPNMMWRWHLHKSTSLAESQKALEAHGCKPWVTNLLIISHTLGILTANITYCVILLEYVNKSQVNAQVVK